MTPRKSLQRFSRTWERSEERVEAAAKKKQEDEDEWKAITSDFNTNKLKEAIAWLRHERAKSDRGIMIEAEPYQWIRNGDEWERDHDYQQKYDEWNDRSEWAKLNIKYANFYDRYDYKTDLGYIMSIHSQAGLDCILKIEEIKTDKWWDPDGYDTKNNVFTEIVIIPAELFLPLSLSPQEPYRDDYHITLVNTADVGKAYKKKKGKLREWLSAYKAIRARYNGKRARLGMDRWGKGYTYYIDDRTVVEGLEHPYNIFSDPDVKIVFRVPGKHKENDDMHVSLIGN